MNTDLLHRYQTSLDKIQRNHLAYALINIDHCRYKGLYAIWFHQRCLYVGQSKKRTVYDRLYEHLSGCHNDKLKLWIDVYKNRLTFTTANLEVDDQEFIDQSEVFLIHSLEPETNKQHN